VETIVKPKIVRLPLSDGRYIDVKRRLNAGEQQDMFAAMAPFLTAGEKPQLKTQAVMTAKILAYLLGWSLTDDGAPIPMSPDLPELTRLSTIRSLDPEDFREIREAIDVHETVVEAEVAQAKNGQAGVSASSKTLSSPDGLVDGNSTGSVN
jgi:hypothetical protein